MQRAGHGSGKVGVTGSQVLGFHAKKESGFHLTGDGKH